MIRGALLMMDALGFKGIWDRRDANDVIETLQKLQTELQEHCANYLAQSGPGRHRMTDYRVEFLSDTVVIGVSVMAESAVRDIVPVLLACRLASRLMRSAASAKVPLAYRGCLALGDFRMDGSFIIGPAVDEAAEAMNAAEGAFVWLAESAFASSLWAVRNRTGDELMLVEYDVPLKGGNSYRTLAVSPFERTTPAAERKLIATSIEGTFGDSRTVDRMLKRQKTSQFLQHAATLD
jgi:hypothetical protein